MSDSELISSYDSDCEMMDSSRRRQLFGQITELQSAVVDMKSAFTAAVQHLETFQNEESGLLQKIEGNKIESDNQASEVLKLILSMKTDFAMLKNQIQTSGKVQRDLQQQIQNLVWERDLLVEELRKSGSISEQIRFRLQYGGPGGGPGGGGGGFVVDCAASGTHSSDSGVSTMMNRNVEPPIDEQDVLGSSYDVEFSLVDAANKSLSLSASLGKLCAMELDRSTAASGAHEDDGEETGVDNSSDKKPSNFEDAREENRGKRVVARVLESERDYCAVLLVLRDTFAEPLRRNDVVSSEDNDTLFPHEVYRIYELHSDFLRELEDATPSNVARIFDKFTDPAESNVLRLYTSYVDDFPEVLRVFHKLCRQKNREFANFLKSRLARPECAGMDLGSFLLAPVRRIPHYILFLKKLLPVVVSDHHQRIRTVLRRLRVLLERLNDTMEHSFQLVASRIRPEDDGPRANSGCSETLFLQNKMAERGSKDEASDQEEGSPPTSGFDIDDETADGGGKGDPMRSQHRASQVFQTKSYGANHCRKLTTATTYDIAANAMLDVLREGMKPDGLDAAYAGPRCQRDCCASGVKGASTECIAANETRRRAVDSRESERRMAKSHSSFAIHRREGGATSEDPDPEARSEARSDGAISHSASSPNLEEKKKISIRTSLKKLLMFKKRCGRGQKGQQRAESGCSDCKNPKADQ